MPQKVLVVDDELHMRTFITTLLETSGYKPLAAENGAEGLALAQKHKPVLVILDIMMPKESGVQMYRELKTDPVLKQTPVIIVSAVSQKTFLHSQSVLDEYNAEQIPAPAAYIEKPPSAEELLEAIQGALGQAA